MKLLKYWPSWDEAIVIGLMVFSIYQPVRYIGLAVGIGIVGGLLSYCFVRLTNSGKKVLRDSKSETENELIIGKQPVNYVVAMRTGRIVVIPISLVCAVAGLTRDYFGSSWLGFGFWQSAVLAFIVTASVLAQSMRWWYPVTHDLRKRDIEKD